MTTPEWEQFMEREGKTLLDAIARDSWAWFTFCLLSIKIFMKHRKRCKNRLAIINQGLHSILSQSLDATAPHYGVGGQTEKLW